MTPPAASPTQARRGRGKGRPKTPAASPLPLRCTPIPRQEPFPAARVYSGEPVPEVAPTQGVLQLVIPERESDATAALIRPATQRRQETPSESRTALLPEPGPWAAAFIQAAMEVTCGLRPSTQLIRWTTPEVHGKLVRRGTLTARALRAGNATGAKPRLRRIVLCCPRDGVYEVSAVIAEPRRVRAVAFRMEGMHGRWRVTEFEMQGRLDT